MQMFGAGSDGNALSRPAGAGRVRETRFLARSARGSRDASGHGARQRNDPGDVVAVARAAADHRRVVGAGDEVFYGDPLLRKSANAHPRAQLIAAIGAADPPEPGRNTWPTRSAAATPQIDSADAEALLEWLRTGTEHEAHARRAVGLTEGTRALAGVVPGPTGVHVERSCAADGAHARFRLADALAADACFGDRPAALAATSS